MKIDSSRYFFVTGGSSGLGLATVVQLLAKGAYVAILDTQQPLVEELGPKAIYANCDITSESSFDKAILQIQSLLTPAILCGGVIHCAGIGAVESVLARNGSANSLDHFKRVIEINLTGSFLVAGRVAALIVNQNKLQDGENKNGRIVDGVDRGIIILVSSTSGTEGQAGMAAYASSKAAVNGLVLPMAREFAKYGIRVQSLTPSVFLTPMGSLVAQPRVHASLSANFVFPPRYGQASEFAHLALTVIENPMLNGGQIRIDGASRVPKM